MRSMAHGRNYPTGFGRKGGTGPNTGKKATSFICTGPDGTRKVKRVFCTSPFSSPVSVWYNHAGIWYLNTVIDEMNKPDWVKNYVIGEAEIKQGT